MQSSTVSFRYSGHYYTLGDPASASSVWFVLHGYGQLASYFIRNFATLEEHNIAVIAPEGLSRFYLEDTASRMKSGNDRVGATWMTKEKRLTDIENYLTFLNEVYQKVIPTKNVPVTILGFSQGAATASRWAIDGDVEFDRLILWAGIFPPDIDFPHARQRLHSKKTLLIYGQQDPFLTDSRFAEMEMLTRKLGIEPEVQTFDGGHEIDKTLLEGLI